MQNLVYSHLKKIIRLKIRYLKIPLNKLSKYWKSSVSSGAAKVEIWIPEFSLEKPNF